MSSQILALIAEHGPMSRLALGDLMPGLSPRILARDIGCMRKATTRAGHRKPKRLFIIRWDVDDALGETQVYPRPVYARGNRPDAPKPPPKTQTERNKARWAKSRIGRGVPNSVFALATLVA